MELYPGPLLIYNVVYKTHKVFYFAEKTWLAKKSKKVCFVSRGRDSGCPPPPRTDPYVRHYRIRLLPRVVTRRLFLKASRTLSSSLHRVCLALCPDPVSLGWVPLGQPPSLHLLRRLLVVTGHVRRLQRYYEVVRLPAPVHHGRTLVGSPCGPSFHGQSQGLPVSVQKVCLHAPSL